MNKASKAALLKLIRERQPITIKEIASLIERDLALRNTFAYKHLLDNLGGYARHAVEDLFSLRLIETQGNTEFTPDAKLKTTQLLPKLQEIFGFSLTRLAEAGENPIQITPLFNVPIPIREKADIFVAMPFQENLKSVYSDHIRKVADILDISCKRGDDFSTSNKIMDDVWSAIFHAKICIVDCTGRNPNVFYELGIAHTLGRRTILITQTMEDIPFDVNQFRTITYKLTPQGMLDFEEALSRTLRYELGIK